MKPHIIKNYKGEEQSYEDWANEIREEHANNDIVTVDVEIVIGLLNYIDKLRVDIDIKEARLDNVYEQLNNELYLNYIESK